MSALSPPPHDPAKQKIRWWPAMLVSAAAFLWIGKIWIGEGDDTQRRVMATFPVIFFTTLALLLWLLLFSRLRGSIRLALLGMVIATFGAVAVLFEIRGVSGNLVPILGWRWGQELAVEGGRGRGTVPGSSAVDHPQFFGPQRDGHTVGPELAADWSARPPRELWRREVGAGWSSFAVVGDAAVTQEQRGANEAIVRYDLSTGEVVWIHADAVRYESTIGGIGPRATPTVADGRVFAMGATGILSSLDLGSGELLWQRDVPKEHRATIPEWGKSCSPLAVDGLVVVSAGGVAGHSLVAYDQRTGELAWNHGSDTSSYSSPTLLQLAGRPQVVIFNQSSLAGHDPATGEVLWTEPWSGGQPNVAVPQAVPGDRLLVSSGYGVGSKLFHLRSEADGLTLETEWESRRLKAKFSNYLIHDGFVYGLDDGIMTCVDLATGERRWKGGRYGHGQLLRRGELLIVQTEKGAVVLVQATPEAHRELGRLAALSSKTWNPPALADGYLLVRNDREAVCYELPIVGIAHR